MFYGMIIVGIVGIMIGILFRGCWDYRKAIKEDLELEKRMPVDVRECSLEEVAKFVREITDKENDKPLDQLFLDWLESEDKGYDLTKTSDPYVEVEEPCAGNECACSPQREDCCPNPKGYETGKCKIIININKLVGISDVIERNPEQITPSEAELLARSLTRFLELQNNDKR